MPRSGSFGSAAGLEAGSTGTWPFAVAIRIEVLTEGTGICQMPRRSEPPSELHPRRTPLAICGKELRVLVQRDLETSGQAGFPWMLSPINGHDETAPPANLGWLPIGPVAGLTMN